MAPQLELNVLCDEVNGHNVVPPLPGNDDVSIPGTGQQVHRRSASDPLTGPTQQMPKQTSNNSNVWAAGGFNIIVCTLHQQCLFVSAYMSYRLLGATNWSKAGFTNRVYWLITPATSRPLCSTSRCIRRANRTSSSACRGHMQETMVL